jgi:hypothetical protein
MDPGRTLVLTRLFAGASFAVCAVCAVCFAHVRRRIVTMSCGVVRAVDEGAVFDDPLAMTPRLFGLWTWPRAAALLAAAMTAAVGACSEESACHVGEYRACNCDDGARGYEQCAGEGYGACDCSGMIPGLTVAASSGSGGSGGGGGAGGAELLPFLSPCTTNEECETGLCHDFNAKGPHCSHACTVPEDCPPPSDGCNGMNICKAP